MIILIIDQGRYAFQVKRLERFDFRESGELEFTCVTEEVSSKAVIKEEIDKFLKALEEGKTYTTKEIQP